MEDSGEILDDIFEEYTEEQVTEAGMPLWGKILFWTVYTLQFFSLITLPISLQSASGNGLSLITAPIFFLLTHAVGVFYESAKFILMVNCLLSVIFVVLALINDSLSHSYFDDGLKKLIAERKKSK